MVTPDNFIVFERLDIYRERLQLTEKGRMKM